MFGGIRQRLLHDSRQLEGDDRIYVPVVVSFLTPSFAPSFAVSFVFDFLIDIILDSEIDSQSRTRGKPSNVPSQDIWQRLLSCCFPRMQMEREIAPLVPRGAQGRNLLFEQGLSLCRRFVDQSRAEFQTQDGADERVPETVMDFASDTGALLAACDLFALMRRARALTIIRKNRRESSRRR